MRILSAIVSAALVATAAGAFAQDKQQPGVSATPPTESKADAKKNEALKEILGTQSITFMSTERELFYVLQLVVDTQWFSFVISPAVQDARASRPAELMNELILFKDALDAVCAQPDRVEWVTWRGVVYVKRKGEKLPAVPRTVLPKAHRGTFQRKVSLTISPHASFDELLGSLKKAVKMDLVISEAVRKRIKVKRLKLGFVLWSATLLDLLDRVLAPLGFSWCTDGETIYIKLHRPKNSKNSGSQ